MDKPVIKTDPNTSSLFTLIWPNGDFWRQMLFPSQATEITLKGTLSGGKVPYGLGSLHLTKGSILQAWWHHLAAGPELRLDQCLPIEYVSAPISVCYVMRGLTQWQCSDPILSLIKGPFWPPLGSVYFGLIPGQDDNWIQIGRALSRRPTGWL